MGHFSTEQCQKLAFSNLKAKRLKDGVFCPIKSAYANRPIGCGGWLLRHLIKRQHPKGIPLVIVYDRRNSGPQLELPSQSKIQSRGSFGKTDFVVKVNNNVPLGIDPGWSFGRGSYA
jgi:hypothetical protein